MARESRARQVAEVFSAGLSRIAYIVLFLAASCAPARAPIPPGVIPDEPAVTAEDDRYGRQVLAELSRQFRISRDQSDIARVTRLVDRLTRDRTADYWHVYVLDDSNTTNAAATRGNYVFVWSGMLDAVPGDNELAAVVSHEIGHVLAGHTTQTPEEEVNRMISGLAGTAAGQYMGGVSGQLAQSILTQVLQGFLVNPEAQRLEYEADQIGLFLMADAGFDPRGAISFWTRASRDPNFSGGGVEFFSTHPSSENRLRRLEAMLPEAESRYRGW